MTEYDDSEEGYQRYLDTQNRISRWVDNTNGHAREFRPPFGTRSDVPSESSRSLTSSPVPSAVRSATRPHEYHGTTSGSGSRSGSDASRRRRSLVHPSHLGPGTERYDVPRGHAFTPLRPSPLAAPVPGSYPHVPLTTQIPPPNPMHPTASSHHLSRGLEMHVSSSRPQYDVSRPRSQSSHSRHDTLTHRSHTITPSHHTATHIPSRSHTLPANMQMQSSSLSRPRHDSDEYRSRPRTHRDSHDHESRSHSSHHDSSRHSRHSSSSHKHHHRRSQSLSIGSGTTAYTIATPTFVSPNPTNPAAPLIIPFAEKGKTYMASIPPGQAPGYAIIPPKGKTVKVIL